ncbi:hypothetical protein [Steroidobacter gossypii]|uniref:hypothetical protein n=1 Tax=Steroidobacter gossypii TaxID=2805490 RepID=UPI001C3FB60C|nr:hypothetical protein [Steroidobacter gossypii]
MAPLEAHDDEEEEPCLAKNQSSVIINFALAADTLRPQVANFLTGGDAGSSFGTACGHGSSPKAGAEYDPLQAPHH